MTDHSRIGGEAREEACLALGHVDAERTPCVLPADDLVRALVAEVTRLRVQVGDAAWPDPERQEAALAEALVAGWTPENETSAPDVFDALVEAGWQLLRVRP